MRLQGGVRTFGQGQIVASASIFSVRHDEEPVGLQIRQKVGEGKPDGGLLCTQTGKQTCEGLGLLRLASPPSEFKHSLPFPLHRHQFSILANSAFRGMLNLSPYPYAYVMSFCVAPI